MTRIINFLITKYSLLWNGIKSKRNHFIIGNNVSLCHPIYMSGLVIIGDGTYINAFSHLKAGGNSSITIGKFCEISYNVHIWAITHDINFPTGPQRKIIEKSIKIGDYVWIGANAFIREGITIGSHSIIGANSVVTKNVPEFTMVAGAPARKVKSLKKE